MQADQNSGRVVRASRAERGAAPNGGPMARVGPTRGGGRPGRVSIQGCSAESVTVSRSPYQIHAEVRRVLARHWVDLDRVQFGVYRDMLRVTGELHQTNQVGGTASIAIFEVLHAELRRIPELRCIQLDFSNWTRDSRGDWKRLCGQGGGLSGDQATAPIEALSTRRPATGEGWGKER